MVDNLINGIYHLEKGMRKMKKSVIFKLTLLALSPYLLSFILYYSWCFWPALDFIPQYLNWQFSAPAMFAGLMIVYWGWVGSYYQKYIKNPGAALLLGNGFGYLSLIYTYIRFYLLEASMRTKIVSLPILEYAHVRNSQPMLEHCKDWLATGYYEWIWISPVNGFSLILAVLFISFVFLAGYFLAKKFRRTVKREDEHEQL